MKTLVLLIMTSACLSSQTLDEVKGYLTHKGLEHQEEIIALIRLETGNLTSNLSSKYNNLFGMMHPRVRPTLSKGCAIANDGCMASFKDWRESVEDFILFIKWQGKRGRKVNDYPSFFDWVLATGYNTVDKEYKNKLNKIKQKNGKQ